MQSNSAVISEIPKPKKIIPGIILAISIVIITEIMFFAGLISAYIIAYARAVDWPPIDQPRLPEYISISNMLILLASGVLLFLFKRKSKDGLYKKSLLLSAVFLAVVFLIIQGTEWINLVNFGIQSSTGLYASYFYSLIAIHGLHVLIGLILLFRIYLIVSKKPESLKLTDKVKAFSIFWYFVVLVWPILYFLLYLL